MEGVKVPDQNYMDSNGKESSFSQLPNYPNNPFVISVIACEECEQVRPGTKCYAVLHMVFLLFGVYTRIDDLVRCPSCMR